MSGPLNVHVDRTPPPDWGVFAAARGTFYHTTAWLEGISRLFRYQTRYVWATDGSGVAGILPLAVVPSLGGGRRLVSYPFSFAVGPVAVDAASAALLVGQGIEEARALGCRGIEIKQSDPGAPVAPSFQRVVHYRSYRVATAAGTEAVWGRLHGDSTRRGIKKAEREGVTVRRGEGVADWTAMAMLQEGTSHQHGTPAPPRAYFEEFCRSLQDAGLADLWLASAPKSGEAVAGVVVWKGPREWIYSFGASRSEFLPLRPNHLLLWRAFQAAADAGVDLNLGRAAPEQEGLVQFKLRWAGQPIDLPYDYWPSPSGLNVRDRGHGALAVAATIWRRLPAPVARWGSRLYRYLG